MISIQLYFNLIKRQIQKRCRKSLKKPTSVPSMNQDLKYSLSSHHLTENPLKAVRSQASYSNATGQDVTRCTTSKTALVATSIHSTAKSETTSAVFATKDSLRKYTCSNTWTCTLARDPMHVTFLDVARGFCITQGLTLTKNTRMGSKMPLPNANHLTPRNLQIIGKWSQGKSILTCLKIWALKAFKMARFQRVLISTSTLDPTLVQSCNLFIKVNTLRSTRTTNLSSVNEFWKLIYSQPWWTILFMNILL